MGRLEPRWAFFGGFEPMFYFAILIDVNGGLEPRWAFFGGFEPILHFPMLKYVNGGLEPRWEFDFNLHLKKKIR